MKAIETVYRGYKYRSRLEARWAVFFDKLGVPYEYEKEGFDLDGEWYLPDFWLPLPEAWNNSRHPGSGYWVEIKPRVLDEREERLLEKLVLHTGHNAYSFAGNVGLREFEIVKRRLRRDTGVIGRADFWQSQDDYMWMIHVDGIFMPWSTKCKIDEALTAARQARFEHGEKG